MLKAMEIYLVLNGKGLEAIAFYQQALGAKVTQINLYKDTLPDCPKELENFVMNAQFDLNGQRFMLSDNHPEMPYQEGNNITVALITDTSDSARELFDNLSVNAKAIEMELQEVPWSPAYGSLVDQFGIHWQINTEILDDSNN